MPASKPAPPQRVINYAFEESKDILLQDVFPVEDGEILKLVFESKKSSWKEGVWLMCDQGITLEDIYTREMILWFAEPDLVIPFVCHTRVGQLCTCNIWDCGTGPECQCHTSGMLVEELPNGKRYHCSDPGFNREFDNLVFRIERTPSRLSGIYLDMEQARIGSTA